MLHKFVGKTTVSASGRKANSRVGHLEHVWKFFCCDNIKGSFIHYYPTSYGPVQGLHFLALGLEGWYNFISCILGGSFPVLINPMISPHVRPHIPCGGSSSLNHTSYPISHTQLAHCGGIFLIVHLFKKFPNLAVGSTLRFSGVGEPGGFFITFLCQLFLHLIVVCNCSLIVNKLSG